MNSNMLYILQVHVTRAAFVRPSKLTTLSDLWVISRDVEQGEELTFKYDWPSGDECLVSSQLKDLKTVSISCCGMSK